MTECLLKHDQKAFGKIIRPDGTIGYLCFAHWLSQKAKEPPNSEYKYVPIKGKEEPPKTNPKLPHDWQRSGLGAFGVHVDWRCTKCNLWIRGSHAYSRPDPFDYGGCTVGGRQYFSHEMEIRY